MDNYLSFQLEEAYPFLQRSWPEIRSQAQSLRLDLPPKIDKIIFCGCGDSHHAAYSLQYVASNYLSRPSYGLNAMQVARFWIPDPVNVDGKTLVIGISASGEVARTLEAIEQAQRVGASTIAFTCNPDSTLAQIADLTMFTTLPEMPAVPGLLSYLGSILMGFGLTSVLSTKVNSGQIETSIDKIIQGLPLWVNQQRTFVESGVVDFDHHLPLVFLASGPAYGSAMFASAKYIEAVGKCSWAEDVEEWAHLEYFCDPSELPIWLLSACGRASSREGEILQAAQVIGRKILHTQWEGLEDISSWESEIFSPLVLWAGPYAFANQIMLEFGEKPFRGFSGGRDIAEGGGASKIRSSWRIEKLGEWRPITEKH